MLASGNLSLFLPKEVHPSQTGTVSFLFSHPRRQERIAPTPQVVSNDATEAFVQTIHENTYTFSHDYIWISAEKGLVEGSRLCVLEATDDVSLIRQRVQEQKLSLVATGVFLFQSHTYQSWLKYQWNPKWILGSWLQTLQIYSEGLSFWVLQFQDAIVGPISHPRCFEMETTMLVRKEPYHKFRLEPGPLDISCETLQDLVHLQQHFEQECTKIQDMTETKLRALEIQRAQIFEEQKQNLLRVRTLHTKEVQVLLSQSLNGGRKRLREEHNQPNRSEHAKRPKPVGNSRGRIPFLKEEQEALLKGVQRHGRNFHQIKNDPEFALVFHQREAKSLRAKYLYMVQHGKWVENGTEEASPNGDNTQL